MPPLLQLDCTRRVPLLVPFAVGASEARPAVENVGEDVGAYVGITVSLRGAFVGILGDGEGTAVSGTAVAGALVALTVAGADVGIAVA